MVVYQQIQATCFTPNGSYPISLIDKGLELKTGRFSKMGQLTTTLYPVNERPAPSTGENLELYINENKAFEGTIGSVEEQDNGGHRIMAYDSLWLLKNTTLNQTFDGAYLKEIIEGVEEATGVTIVLDDAGGIVQPGSEISNEIIENSVPITRERQESEDGSGESDGNLNESGARYTNPDTATSYEDYLQAQGEQDLGDPDTATSYEDYLRAQGGQEYVDSEQARRNADGRLYPRFNDTRADKVVAMIADWCCTSWWLDQNDVIHIGPPEVSTHQLRWVKETNAEIKTIPYQSVKVTGITASMVEGLSGVPIMADELPYAVAGEGDPQYEYESSQAWTRDQCKSIAHSILREFKRNSAGGTITILGDEEIQPLDSISLPEGIGGGHTYLVDSVIHRINPEDGFLTEITCGAPIY